MCEGTAGTHALKSDGYSLCFKPAYNNGQSAKAVYFAQYNCIRLCLRNAVRQGNNFQFYFLHE